MSATAASAGVSPAGLLNGVTAFGSFGSDGGRAARGHQDAVRSVPVRLQRNGAGVRHEPRHREGHPADDQRAWADRVPQYHHHGRRAARRSGGHGDNVNASHLILCKPSDIWRIGSMGIEVSLSRDATIEMATDPAAASDTPVAQANYPVSMFQTASVALRVIIPMNFAKRHACGPVHQRGELR